MAFEEDDFLDFIPDSNNAKARSVFMSAYHPARSDKTIIFRIWMGKDVLEQLVDTQGLSWMNEAVMRVSIRIGQGDKKGQMLIAATRGGNIDLRKGKGDNPNGRSISVRNFPGIQPMEAHEVKWTIVDGTLGKSLHITEYKTGDFSLQDIKRSESGLITDPKPEAPADKKPSQIMAETLTPPAPPPPPKPRAAPSREEQYAAMSNLGKNKKK